MKKEVEAILAKYKKDATRLMDILIDTQNIEGYVSPEAIEIISNDLNLSRVDVEQTVSFSDDSVWHPIPAF